MKILVIGGGAAGMMAAAAAARKGAAVVLLEKNEKLGKKIYITGKGRCNLTNACPDEDFFANVISNPRFMYSSLYGFDSSAVRAFFEEAGLSLKQERGQRIFPQSDRASDVTSALKRVMDKNHVRVHLNSCVSELILEELPAYEEPLTLTGKSSDTPARRCTGAILSTGEKFYADRVIVATGGISYPSTGSTGDGYEFAKTAGHEITELRPALVGLSVKETWVKQLQGLNLKNISARILKNKKELYSGFGELGFMNYGVSGPLMLTASSVLGKQLKSIQAEEPLLLKIDLKPALDGEQLENRLVRELALDKNRSVQSVMKSLLPSAMIGSVLAQAEVKAELAAHMVSTKDRTRLVEALKGFELHITGTRGFNEAIITQGGIKVKNVNPKTMESKLTEGLYFAGEVLDVDALTGGFNLQIAWSTGHAAGTAAAEDTYG